MLSRFFNASVISFLCYEASACSFLLTAVVAAETILLMAAMLPNGKLATTAIPVKEVPRLADDKKVVAVLLQGLECIEIIYFRLLIFCHFSVVFNFSIDH